MESLFRCPLCAQPLDREDRRYHCPQGHSFDRGAAGYVHLLPANQKHAKDPGDDKGMGAARNRFLSGDHYAPLRETLAQLALAHTPDRPVLLDAGCGEGLITQFLTLYQGKCVQYCCNAGAVVQRASAHSVIFHRQERHCKGNGVTLCDDLFQFCLCVSGVNGKFCHRENVFFSAL